MNRASRKLMASPLEFDKHGQCGTEVSELLPYTAGIVDDICVIRSMKAQINNHDLRLFFLGRPPRGRPALAGHLDALWLGLRKQDLPAYVVLSDPASLPVDGRTTGRPVSCRRSFKARCCGSDEPRIVNLDPPSRLRGTPSSKIWPCSRS